MPIRHFIQGQDDDMYCVLGPWLIDARIHKKLGYPITGAEKDQWWIYVADDGKPLGFTQARCGISGWHIRYLYGLDDKTQRRLLDVVLKQAKEKGASLAYTNDREDALIWAEFGFTIKSLKKRGAFRRWEKLLENSNGK